MSRDKRMLAVSGVCFAIGAVLLAVLVFLMAGCDPNGPTPSPSPLATPTPPVEGGGWAQGPPQQGLPVQEGDMEIGGFEVVFLVMGIVQLAKLFGVQGKGSLALALVLGLAVSGLAEALSGGLVPAEAVPYVLLAVRAVGYTLAIPGLYDLVKDEFLPAVGRVAFYQGPPRM